MVGIDLMQRDAIPFESKLLPAVLFFLRVYYPDITVALTVLKFGWINSSTITVTVLASAVTPSLPLIPMQLPSWKSFELISPKCSVTVTVLKYFWIRKERISNMTVHYIIKITRSLFDETFSGIAASEL